MKLLNRPKTKVDIYYEDEEKGFSPIMTLIVDRKNMLGISAEEWTDDRVGKRHVMFLGDWNQRKDILELFKRCGLKFELGKEVK